MATPLADPSREAMQDDQWGEGVSALSEGDIEEWQRCWDAEAPPQPQEPGAVQDGALQDGAAPAGGGAAPAAASDDKGDDVVALSLPGHPTYVTVLPQREVEATARAFADKFKLLSLRPRGAYAFEQQRLLDLKCSLYKNGYLAALWACQHGVYFQTVEDCEAFNEQVHVRVDAVMQQFLAALQRAFPEAKGFANRGRCWRLKERIYSEILKLCDWKNRQLAAGTIAIVEGHMLALLPFDEYNYYKNQRYEALVSLQRQYAALVKNELKRLYDPLALVIWDERD